MYCRVTSDSEKICCGFCTMTKNKLKSGNFFWSCCTDKTETKEKKFQNREKKNK